jgi:hypothetical protein
MTATLYVSENYDESPQVYKNFYRGVIEPVLMVSRGKLISGNDLLKEYNAHWNNETKNIIFDTEQDLTYFMLRWS